MVVLIPSIAQLNVSIQRVQTFLCAEERHGDYVRVGFLNDDDGDTDDDDDNDVVDDDAAVSKDTAANDTPSPTSPASSSSSSPPLSVKRAKVGITIARTSFAWTENGAVDDDTDDSGSCSGSSSGSSDGGGSGGGDKVSGRGGTVDVALKDIHLTVAQGELVAVVGSIGAGKTALFNAILGNMVPVAAAADHTSDNDDAKTTSTAAAATATAATATAAAAAAAAAAAVTATVATATAAVTASGAVVTVADARIALVSQTAWILNATVKDNIIIAAPPTDNRVFNKVGSITLDRLVAFATKHSPLFIPLFLFRLLTTECSTR
jgi:ABC-type multidrug transport system fused ATPase/permease subunit